MLGVHFPRWTITHRRVKAFAIVPEFDVAADVLLGDLVRGVTHPRDTLVFQGGEERFGHGVAEADSGPAGRSAKSQPFKYLGVFCGHVVAATVRVEYRALGELSVSCGVPD